MWCRVLSSPTPIPQLLCIGWNFKSGCIDPWTFCSDYINSIKIFLVDWNITVIDIQYDPPSHKVFVHLRWQLPFSHVGIKQMLIWHNLDHTDQVDAGKTGHILKAAESTSEILKLAPNSEYRIMVCFFLIQNICANKYFLRKIHEPMREKTNNLYSDQV